MWFTRISIKNPVFATMMMLAFVVLGLFSLQRLKVDQFPNIEFPTVVVVIDYPGASPEIVESQVTKKVEEAVNTIAGINALYSRSYEGTAVVVVEFNLDLDGRKAADDVREKVAIVRPALPDDAKEPRISRFDPASRPIFSLAVRADGPQSSGTELTTWADQVLRKKLENVRGVGSVTLVGGVKREINLYLKPKAMEALSISAEAVIAAVKAETQDTPVGLLNSSEQSRVVQVDARILRPEDYKRLIVARRNGQPIYLSQVADVVDGPQELESLALFNGQRTVALDIQKSQGENTVEVVEGLQQVVKDIQGRIPAGMKVEVIRDNSRPIKVAVKNVQRTLFEGAALTILIVFLFLNSWRSTVITGLTLPIAMIGTFLFMYIFGFTFNMITLMALSLCVGLLIDDAIVVRENIVRHVGMGKSAHDAALEGTQEIGLAVLATTFSIVAVFLPIGFMGGIIGKFFREFGITIAAAVLISMFVSFTLDPMLSSVWHDPQAMPHDKSAALAQPSSVYDKTLGRITAWFDRMTQALSRAYQDILNWSLRHKKSTLALATSLFVSSFFIVPLLGSEFVPAADYSETSVNFYTPVGSSLEVTEAKVRQVEALIREMPEVSYTYATLNTGAAQGRNYASIYIRLVDRQLRSKNQAQLTGPLRERLAKVPGITVTHVGLLDAVGGGKPIELSIQGPDLGELQRLSTLARQKLQNIPGLVDQDSSLKANKPTVSIQVKNEIASDVGLSVGQIANTLRQLISGHTASTWRAPDDQSYDVKVRLTPNERQWAEDLAHLPLLTSNGQMVQLDQVADIKTGVGPNQINRRDMNREVKLDGNHYMRTTGEISADIRTALDQIDWPVGYRYVFGGATKNMQESFTYALSALGLAIVFIYMILASQFKSFVQPLALMSSLPLTLIGVVLALLLFGSTLNMFSIIGVVMLMGLVTKNAILLVDFAIRARETGLDREEALLQAAHVRLRPILMTTLAMIFGMVPLAFALTEGSEQRAPMGQAVIGGVITSSLLTLVVVPVIYCYMDDLSKWLTRKKP